MLYIFTVNECVFYFHCALHARHDFTNNGPFKTTLHVDYQHWFSKRIFKAFINSAQGRTVFKVNTVQRVSPSGENESKLRFVMTVVSLSPSSDQMRNFFCQC